MDHPGESGSIGTLQFGNLHFLAIDAIERRTRSDDLGALAGSGRPSALAAGALTPALLSLAGLPPLGGFVGKAMLFGAALGSGWAWLAAVMGANVAVSLYHYVRVLEPIYFARGTMEVAAVERPLAVALLVLGVGTLLMSAAASRPASDCSSLPCVEGAIAVPPREVSECSKGQRRFDARPCGGRQREQAEAGPGVGARAEELGHLGNPTACSVSSFPRGRRIPASSSTAKDRRPIVPGNSAPTA